MFVKPAFYLIIYSWVCLCRECNGFILKSPPYTHRSICKYSGRKLIRKSEFIIASEKEEIHLNERYNETENAYLLNNTFSESIANNTVENSGFFRKISVGSVILGTLLGFVGTIAILFIPIYLDENSSQSKAVLTSIDKIQSQVSLFGDILYDLETGYVDPINPNKLFETAVTAMLKSLDPYTEYENVVAAKSMQESVSGKYGGVGLIISNAKDLNADVSNQDVSDASNTANPPISSIPSISSSYKSINSDNSINIRNGQGVEVIDSFEGYAYDAGLRIGKKQSCCFASNNRSNLVTDVI